MRGHSGTSILWYSSLNPVMKKLPETNTRINVVELKCVAVSFCLVNVYLPARGLAEHEILFEECLNMPNEVFTKYSPTHTIICGRDFNASLHQVDWLRQDILFYSFLTEHGIQSEASYSIKYTFFHTANVQKFLSD